MSNRARHHGDARKRPQAQRASRARRWLRRSVQLTLALLLLPVLLIGLLRFVDPPVSAFMLAYRLESGRAADYRWRPLDEIAPALAIAVVPAEDVAAGSGADPIVTWPAEDSTWMTWRDKGHPIVALTEIGPEAVVLRKPNATGLSGRGALTVRLSDERQIADNDELGS